MMNFFKCDEFFLVDADFFKYMFFEMHDEPFLKICLIVFEKFFITHYNFFCKTSEIKIFL